MPSEKTRVKVGGRFYELSEMSGRKYAESKEYVARLKKGKRKISNDELSAIMVAFSLSDKEGRSPNHNAVFDLPMRQLNVLCVETMKLNGLSAKAQEEMAKN
jgi:hypothetical protein